MAAGRVEPEGVSNMEEPRRPQGVEWLAAIPLVLCLLIPVVAVITLLTR